MPGRWVEVRPVEEILTSLDPSSAVEGLPFMPEMIRHCGRRYRVRLRAERTCVFPPEVPLRRLASTVVLEGLRCDGAAHGGCQLGCMLMWKEEWLRPVDGPRDGDVRPEALAAALPVTRGAPSVYFCQGTELRRATTPGEPLWRPGQWLRLLRVRTFTLAELAEMFSRLGIRKLARLVRPGRSAGTPNVAAVASPALQPGAWVEIRSRHEILRTLDRDGRHRGLAFSGEMYAFCGRRMRVARRVDRIIAEDTGRLREVRDTVILEGSLCDRYLGCARGMPVLWRKAWLKPLAAPAVAPGRRMSATSAPAGAAHPEPP